MRHLLHRFVDFILPRACVVCGCRLGVTEEAVCTACNMTMPRTRYDADMYGNEMARLFWGHIPVERAVAMVCYEPQSPVSRIVYSLKYLGRHDVGGVIGRLMATEFMPGGFFEGIDMIVPVPLSKDRYRSRGYNQSMEIAEGIGEITGIPVVNDIVRRVTFTESQTKKHRWQRTENVEGAFRLCNGVDVGGKHILIVDDIVTTGSTIISCAEEIGRGGDVRFSILTFGYTKG